MFNNELEMENENAGDFVATKKMVLMK